MILLKSTTTPAVSGPSSAASAQCHSSSRRNQRTLHRRVKTSGIGLFTGHHVTLSLIPAPENTGVRFRRVDLPDRPTFPAAVDYVRGTPRCTIIGKGDVCIQTVEHILSAIKAYDIDNVLIEVDGCEVPICDGSSLSFIELIEHGGVAIQKATRRIRELEVPIFWSRGDVHLVALPASEFRVSYMLSYPHSSLLHSQFFSAVIDEENYRQDIAPCRTFSLYEETVPLIEQGLIKGGSLENAVVIKGDTVLNPEGLRFVNEPARHKVLDLVGDISLVGHPFLAHIIAIRSGHFSNIAFARELLNYFVMEQNE